MAPVACVAVCQTAVRQLQSRTGAVQVAVTDSQCCSLLMVRGSVAGVQQWHSGSNVPLCLTALHVINSSAIVMSYKHHLQQLYSADEQAPKVLDARPGTEYLQQRLKGAVNIDLLHLTSRCFLLPDKHTPFAVVVPSPCAYTITDDASKHGQQLSDMSVAVFLKGTESLQEFLTSRGWAVICFLQDEPLLWAAAGALGLLEQQVSDPQILAMRRLFAPSQLLSSSIASIEARLAAQHACKGHKQQQQQQQQQQDSVGSAGSNSNITQLLFRALDIGCGSGRDTAWLASRQASTVVSDSGHSLHQQKQPLQQQCTAVHPQQSVQVSWHVTGLDEWLGALERAHDLAEALQLSSQQMRLVFGGIDKVTGGLQLMHLPETSRLQSATHATVVHAAAPQKGPSAAAAVVGPQGGLLATVLSNAQGDAGACVGLAAAVLDGDGCCSGKFDVVLCVRFLERSLLPHLRDVLKPGGFILYSTFVDGPGVRAFGRPSGPEHVLQPGELASSYLGPEQGSAVLQDTVVLSADGRELCHFVAQLVSDTDGQCQ